MTKKDFIALADAIRPVYDRMVASGPTGFADAEDMAQRLASCCNREGKHFNRERWLGCLRGQSGPNGGKR